MSQQPWMPIKLHEGLLQLNGKSYAIVCYMECNLQANRSGQPQEKFAPCRAMDMRRPFLCFKNTADDRMLRGRKGLAAGLIACST